VALHLPASVGRHGPTWLPLGRAPHAPALLDKAMWASTVDGRMCGSAAGLEQPFTLQPLLAYTNRNAQSLAAAVRTHHTNQQPSPRAQRTWPASAAAGAASSALLASAAVAAAAPPSAECSASAASSRDAAAADAAATASAAAFWAARARAMVASASSSRCCSKQRFSLTWASSALTCTRVAAARRCWVQVQQAQQAN